MLSHGLYDDPTLIHLGELKPNSEFKRIFKRSHRFISYPYVYTRKSKSDLISFTYFEYHHPFSDDGNNQNNDIYSFKNPEGYNDFIGFYWKTKQEYKLLLINIKMINYIWMMKLILKKNKK